MRAALTADQLRETGIPVLGRLPWSAHLSLFYETRADLLDALIPYFKAGLRRKELCVWLWSDQTRRRALEAGLRNSLAAYDRHLPGRNVEFVDGRAWLRPGHFDAASLMQKWTELIERARAGKFAGLRAAGDHSWLGKGDWRDFSDYEESLHAFVANWQILFLCTYPLPELRATDILDSGRAHDIVIARRHGTWEILESPTLKATKEQIQRRNEALERSVAERTRQLARSEAYLAEGQRLTRSGSFAIDMATGQYSYVSPENLRIFGFDPNGRLPGRDDVMDRVHRDDGARVPQVREAAWDSRHDRELEFRVVRPDGDVRYIYAITRPVVDQAGRLVEIVGSNIDVTDRKHAAAKLARAKRVTRDARLAAAFEERTRLAREIHDSLLQSVTGIALQLRATLPRLGGAPSSTTESIRSVVELAESTIRDARRAVWDMRAPSLVEKGLAKALEETVRRTAGSVALDFAIEGKLRPLPPEVEDTIFRIAQESTGNVVKHAAAQRIRLRLTYKPRSVRLTVGDDGRGFRVEELLGVYAGRWGLMGMRERADRIGASLAIRSAPGRGTTVTLRIPLARANQS